MLLQTNSYFVPSDRRAEHERLIRRFRTVMGRLGCELFEVYEQVGPNWSGTEAAGRFVQIMRFRDRKHQLAVQAAERTDQAAQALIAEFCDLINLPHQQQQSMFLVGYYRGVVSSAAREVAKHTTEEPQTEEEQVPQEEPAMHLEEPPVEEHAVDEQIIEQPVEEVVQDQPLEAPPISKPELPPAPLKEPPPGQHPAAEAQPVEAEHFATGEVIHEEVIPEVEARPLNADAAPAVIDDEAVEISMDEIDFDAFVEEEPQASQRTGRGEHSSRS